LYEYFHIYLALSLLPYPTGVDITLIPYLDRIVKKNVAYLGRKTGIYDPPLEESRDVILRRLAATCGCIKNMKRVVHQ
jgi:hypothetical protein